MRVGDDLHLTYCTNIHPAVGWEAVLASLRAHAPALKARLSPHAPFGIGLRLSGAESSRAAVRVGARALPRPGSTPRACTCFTINGFPHGTFHGQPVKADVHAPDWRTGERVAYTLRLAEILTALLPDGVDGTISTNPLSYGPWLDASGRAAATRNLVRVGAELRGTRVALAIEPEADGALANVSDLIAWWPDSLDATVCFDACHSAVAYEDPDEAARRAGRRRDPRRQGAAVRGADGAGDRARRAARVRRPDLPAPGHRARLRPHLAGPPRGARGDGGGEEWRVHFHVPIFVERYGALQSTQAHLRRCIERVQTSHLEIETYTWDVLPAT